MGLGFKISQEFMAVTEVVYHLDGCLSSPCADRRVVQQCSGGGEGSYDHPNAVLWAKGEAMKGPCEDRSPALPLSLTPQETSCPKTSFNP